MPMPMPSDSELLAEILTELRRLGPRGRTREDVKRAVLLSINGVANGMRNTG